MLLRQKNRTNGALTLVLSMVCVALIAAGVLLFLKQSAGGQTIRRPFQVEGLDPNAQIGAPPGTPKDNRSFDKNTFGYRINSTPEFSKDGTNGKILLQNPPANDYLMVLEIARDDKVLYCSQYIAPNQYIETIDLLQPLDSGKYGAIAYIHAVNPATMDIAGTLECPITITIK